MSTHERREVLYSGRVQGVGFRYTTREIAERFNVTGYVENLSDGRVELVAEGEPAEIDRFLAAVEERLARYIASTQIRSRPATGEFAGFFIRR
ncbi:MAG TPA: acylphosphatase [Pirellulales bacterium]|jgi:acylphosphatase|nr:acylphosphatase [Pirellulales bacterium]